MSSDEAMNPPMNLSSSQRENSHVDPTMAKLREAEKEIRERKRRFEN